MSSVKTPLYRDWSFWAVVVAFVALVLSQLPPIHLLVKGSAIDLEVYPKLSLTHKVGNPNLQLHVLVSNVGGNKIRVKEISASIEREGKKVATLPAQNYLIDPTTQNTALFTGFSLNPGEEWRNIINLLEYFDRETEARYRKLEAQMVADYQYMSLKTKGEAKELVEISEEYVKPFHIFFEEHFVWLPGEYIFTIKVSTNHEPASITKKYRFTVFESHAENLRGITDRFKYGGGIWWNPTDIPLSVVIGVKEA